MTLTATNSPPTAGAGTLRDMFAGQMAAAFIIAPKQAGVARPDMIELARMAYEAADALMKVRGG